jgi:hypothetical protein
MGKTSNSSQAILWAFQKFLIKKLAPEKRYPFWLIG